MLRMPSPFRAAATLILLMFCSTTLGGAKCADSIIRVNGEIIGNVSQTLRVTVEIHPDPRRDMPVQTVTKRQFELSAKFDNFASDVPGGEICGRPLESLAIVVLEGSKEVARIKLDGKKDFVRDDKTWNYSLRESVEIQLPKR